MNATEAPVLLPERVHIAHVILAKADGNGGGAPLLFNFDWIHANMIQVFSLGALALACSIFWARRGKQTGQVIEKIAIACAAAFVAFANWQDIGTLMQHAVNKGG